MKKILIILIALSFNCFGQYDMYITNIESDTICLNQTIKLTVHIDTGLVSHPNNTTDIEDSTGTWGVHNITIQRWIDSNFTMSFTIYSFDMSPGIHKIWCPDGINPRASKTLLVSNCYADIQAYHSPEDLISTEYYNLLGQPIKQPEGITVEVKTYKRGYRETRKVIINP